MKKVALLPSRYCNWGWPRESSSYFHAPADAAVDDKPIHPADSNPDNCLTSPRLYTLLSAAIIHEPPRRSSANRDAGIRSDRPVAAIHHHDRSGDIGRHIGRQEDRRPDDVFGGAGASERGVVDEHFRQRRIA